jgi:hypothetical protein
MNWDAIGAVGEILGALAVVATLAYLAMQTKQSRRATLADVYQSRAHARGASALQIALNAPNFHEIIFRFEENLKVMSPIEAVEQHSDLEKYLLRMFHSDLMVRMDNVYFQYQQGFMSDDYLETAKRGLERFVPIWKALGMENQFPLASIEFFEEAGGDGIDA